jgi:hypothetical protein
VAEGEWNRWIEESHSESGSSDLIETNLGKRGNPPNDFPRISDRELLDVGADIPGTVGLLLCG